jgi:signal transduction histidine kinase
MSIPAFVYGSFQAGSSLLIGIVAFYSAVAYAVPWPWIVGLAIVLIAAERGEHPLSGAPFVLAVCALSGAGGYLARRLRELSAANAALRELVEKESAATMAAAVDDERSRIARELHDILSHSLAVVALQTAAAEHAWNSDRDRARDAVHAARTTSLEAIEQLKTLLTVVHDDPGGRRPLPTVDDLAALARTTTAAGFSVGYTVSGLPRPLSPQVQASVYRVAQEGIANAMKHSGGHGCAIHLDYRPGEVVVEVTDDGRRGRQGTGSRLGLAGVKERAAVFGGRMVAGPQPSGGWRLEVGFPG